MPNGAVFLINAIHIAENWARYYADKEASPLEAVKVLNEEIKIVMEDPSELIDWAQNNMDWSDLSHLSSQIESSNVPDYDELYSEAQMEVVDIL